MALYTMWQSLFGSMIVVYRFVTKCISAATRTRLVIYSGVNFLGQCGLQKHPCPSLPKVIYVQHYIHIYTFSIVIFVTVNDPELDYSDNYFHQKCRGIYCFKRQIGFCLPRFCTPLKRLHLGCMDTLEIVSYLLPSMLCSLSTYSTQPFLSPNTCTSFTCAVLQSCQNDNMYSM